MSDRTDQSKSLKAALADRTVDVDVEHRFVAYIPPVSEHKHHYMGRVCKMHYFAVVCNC